MLYEGVRYYKTARGYLKADGRHGGAYLARVVYSDTYGNVPHGWHVHHKDGDKLNNAIENLQCLSSREHAALHPEKPWPTRTFVCLTCGKEYQAKVNGMGNYTCSNNCAVKRSYQKRKA